MNLPKVYEPHEYESDIYALWEKSGAFVPKYRGSKDTFSIVIPPPNANGNLHLGHGLTLGIEDVMIRYNRMFGKKTLFLPGADHAGFETQVVFEKQLAKEGKSRFDFSREELYNQIWDFVAQNRDNYESQFRKLGASLDWTRYVYTLDEKIVERAYETFKKMWDEKLIYRGERLVNYCTFHRTGFADIEVAYEDAQTPLYYLKYGPFELATTRPETILGDVAVAVHPDDTRYKDLVNRVVTIDGPDGSFDVEVIADDMVDPEFGTGVVKITPAHSFDDWDAAQRHNLPAVRVINHDGTMNEKAGSFRGMTIMEAREAVVKVLEEKGLLLKIDKDYHNRVGACYKCGTVIEPMLMDQWFIDMQPLAKQAIEALEAGKITFHPASKKKQLITYLQGLRDWNISRQIAWGIPIPAFQNVDDKDDWIFDTQVDQEILERDGKTYHRDPDVFDTWFSSGSWPYATLDYPDGEDFNDFYPLSVMETGADILYPWVSRMIMLGVYITGDIPFENVYLHGLVLDEHGAKMSKSKGNVVNPMEKVDQYGSDAFRMGMLNGQSAGNNQSYDENRLVAARNFCNKLWNIARYIEDRVGDAYTTSGSGEPEPDSPADLWLMSRLETTIQQITELLDKLRFSEAYEALYHFVWDDFADWYIEASKVSLNADLLAYGLGTILKLAHPFAPFVTETIWQTLKWEEDSILAVAKWPKASKTSADQSQVFEEIRDLVTEIRFVTTSLKVSKPRLVYQDDEFVNKHAELLKVLAKLSSVDQVDTDSGLQLTNPRHGVWLDLDPATVGQFTTELAGKIKQTQQSIAQLEGRLANKAYVDKAPEALVEQTKQQLTDAKELLEKQQQEYKRFS